MVSALNSALAGLAATQARIDTVSRNVANASTPGYSRKTQQTLADPVAGVRLATVSRSVDDALQGELRRTGGALGYLDSQIGTLQRIEALAGDPSGNSSLAGDLTRLKAALQDLSANPDKPTQQSLAVDAAKTLASTLNRLYDAAEREKLDVDGQLSDAASNANRILGDLKGLNSQILSGRAAGADVTDLEDRRDSSLAELGGLLPVTTFTDDTGNLQVYTSGGTPLLDGEVHALSVSGGRVLTQQGSAPPVPLSVSGGAIGGLLESRQTTLPGFQAKLDDMARAVTGEFAAVGIEVFDDAGATSLDPTDPTQVKGYARRIAVNDAFVADPSLLRNGATPGDTTTIDAALAIFDKTTVGFTAQGLPATGSLASVASSLVTDYAQRRATLQTQRDDADGLKSSIEKRVATESGVNVDEEFAKLTELQQAYQASAQIIAISKQLMDDLVTAVR